MPLYQQIAGGAVLALLTLCVAGWLQAAARWRRGEALVPLAPRRPAPWTGWDVAIGFIAFVLAPFLLAQLWFELSGNQSFSIADATPQQLVVLLLAQGVGNLVSGGATVLLANRRAGATGADLGLSLGELVNDLKVGGLAFCMLAPPVLAIQAVLTQWYPSEHPLIEMLQDGMTGRLFAVAVFVAVIAAPLAEEFFFRVMLQGWLESLGPKSIAYRIVARLWRAESWGRSNTGKPGKAIDGELGPPVNPSHATSSSGPIQGELMPSAWDTNPYAAPRVPATDAVPDEKTPDTSPSHQVARWPIFISSAIFALLHLGNGPDPIPLFFLALGLGYLYRQTHRLTPSVTVHFLLNACSMTLLWMELTFGKTP